MLMQDLFHSLESKEEYRKWHKSHAKSYLAHILVVLDGGDPDLSGIEKITNWQIGFYNPNDTLACFDMKDSQFNVEEEAKIFKKPGDKVQKLDLKKVKIDLSKALEEMKSLQTKKYPQSMPVRKFIVLQNSNEFGLVYNTTYITRTMETLNIKINAETGETSEECLHKLFDMDAGKIRQMKNSKK